MRDASERIQLGRGDHRVGPVSPSLIAISGLFVVRR
jgi:hypothetical protein